MKLGQFLANKAVSEFEVLRTEMETTESNGEKIAVLYLKNPIPQIQGSMTVTDDDNGSTQRMEAYEVDVVRIHERDFEAEGIELNEDGTGKVKTSLRLDVSSRGDIWLTSKSFAAFRREKAQERSSTRRSGIVSKMQERKAQSLLKGADTAATKPVSVAENAKPAGAKIS